MSTYILANKNHTLHHLADVACMAAEELDSFSRGEHVEPRAIIELSEYIRTITRDASGDDTLAVASMRLNLVRKAIVGFELRPTELATISQVLDRATSIVATLENTDSSDNFTNMRDFCIALSKVAAAEAKYICGHPTPRYRR